MDSAIGIAPAPNSRAGAPGMIPDPVLSGMMALSALAANATLDGLASASVASAVLWASAPIANLAALVLGATLNLNLMGFISGTNDADDDLGLDLQWVNSAGTATSIAKATLLNAPNEQSKLLDLHAMARVLKAGATGTLVGGVRVVAGFGTPTQAFAVSAIAGVTSLDLNTQGGYFRLLGDWPVNTGASTTFTSLCAAASLSLPYQ